MMRPQTHASYDGAFADACIVRWCVCRRMHRVSFHGRWTDACAFSCAAFRDDGVVRLGDWLSRMISPNTVIVQQRSNLPMLLVATTHDHHLTD